MLNDLEITVAETIIFDNLRKTSERLTDLENLDGDRWSTVPYSCNRIEKLENKFTNLIKVNKDLNHKNEILNRNFLELNEKYTKIIENQEKF